MRRWLAGVAAFCLLAGAPARALDIQLISGDWQPITIFVELFAGEEQLDDAHLPSDIIAADLAASGNFRVQKETQHSRALDEERLADIRERDGEYLLTGEILADLSGYSLRFSLYDVLTATDIGSYTVPFEPSNQRLAAHSVSNWIYEEIIGKPGVFHTKIAYVLRSPDGTSELKVADYDGHNRLTVLKSDTTIISPAWSPDGNHLLYVSFEQDKPVIYRQSLLSGTRDIIANFKGSNSAPAYAPDNRTIAAALTLHGGVQQLYLLQAGDDGAPERLRESRGINTEPVFSPDGERVAFTSDESGAPQVYEYDRQSARARRLTFGSSYSVSPDYSADGAALAFIRRDGNGDNVAVLDAGGGGITALTKLRAADSPSFAPNDDMIAFVDESRKKHLATVAINGKVLVLWDRPEGGKIVDPVWSPVKSDWF